MTPRRYPGLRQVYAIECRRVPTGMRIPEESFRPIQTPEQAANFFKAATDRSMQETVVALHLDARHRPVAIHEAARGAANAVHLAPKDIFAPAFATGSQALIIAHNHPSGDPRPSTDDVALTHRMEAAGELVGLPVLDHLVIGDEDAYSFKNEHLMSKLWERDKSYSSGGWGTVLAAAAGLGLLALVLLFPKRRETVAGGAASGYAILGARSRV